MQCWINTACHTQWLDQLSAFSFPTLRALLNHQPNANGCLSFHKSHSWMHGGIVLCSVHCQGVEVSCSHVTIGYRNGAYQWRICQGIEFSEREDNFMWIGGDLFHVSFLGCFRKWFISLLIHIRRVFSFSFSRYLRLLLLFMCSSYSFFFSVQQTHAQRCC